MRAVFHDLRLKPSRKGMRLAGPDVHCSRFLRGWTMIFQLLQFVIAILLVVIFWELSKIYSILKKTLPFLHQEQPKER